MISLAYLIALERTPEPAYPEYGEVRAEARRRCNDPIDPASLDAYRKVIAAHDQDWRRSVLGRDVPQLILGRGGLPWLELEMLRVAHERGLQPPQPAWLAQWKAESAETRRLQAEARQASERRTADVWAAALETCGLTDDQLEVRPNVRSLGVRHGVRHNLLHVVPLVDARSAKRLHRAGRELCTVSHIRVLGELCDQPATCVSCVRYTAEIRPADRSPS